MLLVWVIYFSTFPDFFLFSYLSNRCKLDISAMQVQCLFFFPLATNQAKLSCKSLFFQVHAGDLYVILLRFEREFMYMVYGEKKRHLVRLQ